MCLAELELVGGGEFHVAGHPECSGCGHVDVTVPVDAGTGNGTGDAPAFECGLRCVGVVGAFSHEVAGAAQGCDDLEEFGFRIHEEVVDAVFGNCKVLAACAGLIFGVEAHDEGLCVSGCAEVVGPILVLAELELVGSLELDALGHVPGAVGGHLDVLVPLHPEAGDRADDAPLGHGIESGIGQEGFGEGDGLGGGIIEEVVGAVGGNREVLAVGRCGQRLSDGHDERLDIAGSAAVVVPAAVVADLELVGSGELEPLGNMLAAVGEHCFILVPGIAGAGDIADHAPSTLLGVGPPGIALRHGHFDYPGTDRDEVLAVDESVDAAVLGGILQGHTHCKFHCHGAAFGLTHTHKGLGQVGFGDADLAVGNVGGEGLAHLRSVEFHDGKGVVQGHILVEPHIDGTRGELCGHTILVDIVAEENGGSALRGIEHGGLLMDAGGGAQKGDACNYVAK